MKQMLKRQHGFLLIDVIIAMVILTVGLFAVVSMFIQSSKTVLISSRQTVAAHLSQIELENLKTKSWDWLTDDKNFSDTELEKADPNNSKLKYYLKVQKPQLRSDIGDGDNVMEGTVSVRWMDNKGNDVIAKYVAYYTKQVF